MATEIIKAEETKTVVYTPKIWDVKTKWTGVESMLFVTTEDDAKNLMPVFSKWMDEYRRSLLHKTYVEDKDGSVFPTMESLKPYPNMMFTDAKDERILRRHVERMTSIANDVRAQLIKWIGMNSEHKDIQNAADAERIRLSTDHIHCWIHFDMINSGRLPKHVLDFRMNSRHYLTTSLYVATNVTRVQRYNPDWIWIDVENRPLGFRHIASLPYFVVDEWEEWVARTRAENRKQTRPFWLVINRLGKTIEDTLFWYPM